jgi:hypothetical protein
VLTIGIGGSARLVKGADVEAQALPPPASRPIDFGRDVEPIFANHCYSCHGAKKQESALRLDQKAGAMRGGETFGTNAIVVGKSAESVLVQAVSHVHPELKMPKKGDRLTPAQVGVLRAWIDQGAFWPETALARTKNPKDHWAFKPPARPPVPNVKAKGWPRTPIDNFVLARLEKEKLKPAPEADKIALLRRLSLDLVGLPPTIEDVDNFLADKSLPPTRNGWSASEFAALWRTVGRHWLDAARFADSDGYERICPARSSSTATMSSTRSTTTCLTTSS